jgi:hypothetical protein
MQGIMNEVVYVIHWLKPNESYSWSRDIKGIKEELLI